MLLNEFATLLKALDEHLRQMEELQALSYQQMRELRAQIRELRQRAEKRAAEAAEMQK